MLSKNQVELIQKLHHRKYRNKLNLFIVEGKKSINEFLQVGYTPQLLIATRALTTNMSQHLIIPVSKDKLRKVNTPQDPDKDLAVFQQPEHKDILQGGIIVTLDNAQDPDNLDTIVHLRDWLGVETLLCSTQTIDCYNPKVVQATTGSPTHVAVHYLDLVAFLATTALPVYTTDLEDENLYTAAFPKDCILILGNEANGISSEVRALSSKMTATPRFSQHQHTESFNVAMAGAIILSEAVEHH